MFWLFERNQNQRTVGFCYLKNTLKNLQFSWKNCRCYGWLLDIFKEENWAIYQNGYLNIFQEPQLWILRTSIKTRGSVPLSNNHSTLDLFPHINMIYHMVNWTRWNTLSHLYWDNVTKVCYWTDIPQLHPHFTLLLLATI